MADSSAECKGLIETAEQLKVLIEKARQEVAELLEQAERAGPEGSRFVHGLRCLKEEMRNINVHVGGGP